MANLQHLNLAGNRWTGLLSHAWFQPGVSKWQNLKVLDLSNNPMSNGGGFMDLPPSFVNMSLVEIRVRAPQRAAQLRLQHARPACLRARAARCQLVGGQRCARLSGRPPVPAGFTARRSLALTLVPSLSLPAAAQHVAPHGDRQPPAVDCTCPAASVAASLGPREQSQSHVAPIHRGDPLQRHRVIRLLPPPSGAVSALGTVWTACQHAAAADKPALARAASTPLLSASVTTFSATCCVHLTSHPALPQARGQHRSGGRRGQRQCAAVVAASLRLEHHRLTTHPCAGRRASRRM